jgi:hypothetical protein
MTRQQPITSGKRRALLLRTLVVGQFEKELATARAPSVIFKGLAPGNF